MVLQTEKKTHLSEVAEMKNKNLSKATEMKENREDKLETVLQNKISNLKVELKILEDDKEKITLNIEQAKNKIKVFYWFKGQS